MNLFLNIILFLNKFLKEIIIINKRHLYVTFIYSINIKIFFFIFLKKKKKKNLRKN